MQLSIPDLDLRHIYESGQCFRWEPLGQDTYRIPAFGRTLTVRQTDGVFDFSCGAGEFDALWRSYFDLDTDYAAIKARVAPRDAYLQAAVAYGWGMRILRQDLWEVIVSFIVSQNNNIKRIRGIVENLCTTWGEPLPGGRSTFPRPEVLAGLTLEELQPLRSGFRAKYILDAARKVASGEVDLDRVARLPTEEAAAELCRIHGVGIKVAHCALLYGFHRIECLPVDVWMKRVMSVMYPQGLPEELLPYAGIAQQYLFHFSRSHPERFEV